MFIPNIHHLRLLTSALLVCLLISACGPNAKDQQRISETAASLQKVAEELAKKQTEEQKKLEDERKQVEYCANEIESMKAVARKAKEAKKYAEAVAILKSCYGTTTDGDAIGIYIFSSDRLKAIEANKDAIAAKRKGVSIGMTKEEVTASSWGRPQKINQTHGSFGTHEQWVYRGGYLYFENGTLSAVQN